MPGPDSLICRAPHPLRHLPRFAGRGHHGAEITRAPAPHLPTGRILYGKDAALDGACVNVWCAKCQAWTEYRAVDAVCDEAA